MDLRDVNSTRMYFDVSFYLYSRKVDRLDVEDNYANVTNSCILMLRIC